MVGVCGIWLVLGVDDGIACCYERTYPPCQDVGAKARRATVVDVEDGVSIGHAEEGVGVEEAVLGLEWRGWIGVDLVGKATVVRAHVRYAHVVVTH